MNGSILSSLYPTLGIAKHASAELLLHPSKIGEREKILEDLSVFHDFLPPYLCSKTKVKIEFDLMVKEYGQESAHWTRLKRQAGRSGVNKVLLLGVLADGSHELIQGDESPTLTNRDLKYKKFSLLLLIELDRLSEILPSPKSAELNKRTVLFATELIGGYRTAIQRLQALIGERNGFSVAGGQVSNSEYHATLEDACRLICHFSYFEKAATPLIRDAVASIQASGISAFEELRYDRNRYHQVLDSLQELWRVQTQIIQRKLLEFSIYRQMCLDAKSEEMS